MVCTSLAIIVTAFKASWIFYSESSSQWLHVRSTTIDIQRQHPLCQVSGSALSMWGRGFQLKRKLILCCKANRWYIYIRKPRSSRYQTPPSTCNTRNPICAGKNSKTLFFKVAIVFYAKQSVQQAFPDISLVYHFLHEKWLKYSTASSFQFGFGR